VTYMSLTVAKTSIKRRTEPASRVGSAVDAKSIQAEVEALEGLDLGELRVQWRNRWGRLAPASLPRGLLWRVMAYRLQADAFGDLDRERARMLDRLASDASAALADHKRSGTVPRIVGSTTNEPVGPGAVSAAASGVEHPMILKPGALLTREWRGRIERVMALEKGFTWNGQTFGSLSGVALAITGVKWSGQRFFFGSAGRDGTKATATAPCVPSRDKSPATSTRAGAGMTRMGSPSSSASADAAGSAPRPNWRRPGVTRKGSGSWEGGR
jgi:Protein of unknown function (DUF2924)